MHYLVATRRDPSDLQPRDVGNFDGPVNRRLVVDVMSHIAGGNVRGPRSGDTAVPRHIQGRCRLNPDDSSFNTQSPEPSAGTRYFSTCPAMLDPRLKS